MKKRLRLKQQKQSKSSKAVQQALEEKLQKIQAILQSSTTDAEKVKQITSIMRNQVSQIHKLPINVLLYMALGKQAIQMDTTMEDILYEMLTHYCGKPYKLFIDDYSHNTEVQEVEIELPQSLVTKWQQQLEKEQKSEQALLCMVGSHFMREVF